MLREIGGRYQLQRKLGAGAWATVYEALDTGALERRVAIKVFRLPPPDEGSTAAEEHARFRQGARAAGRLSHPNIVSVFDFGEDAETAWIVMELVEGETLKALLDRTGRLPASEIVRLMGQILDALAYTHSRGVVHRDIKPANIMLTQDGVAKITDFGVARIENSSMTHVGTVLGSPAYMAPEQFRGDETDHRADIWAAGVILYQMLTGERPFEGVMTSVMQKALYVEPVLPSRTKAAVPPQFDAVVSKALAKRPEDRFSSAEEFSQAIRAAASAAGKADSPAGNPYFQPPHEDATMVSVRPSARAVEGERARASSTARRPPPPAARPSSGRRGRSRKPLVVAAVAGGAVLAAAAAGVLFLTPAARGPGATGTPGPQVADASAGTRATTAPPQVAPPSPPARNEATGPSEPRPPAAEMPPASPQQVPPPAPRLADPLPPPAPPPQQEQRTALLPAPVPEPVPPQGSPRRPDFDAAASAAASAVNCGVVVPAVDESGVTLTGVARQGETAAAEAVLAALGVPASAVRFRVEPFDGPYCDVLSRVRPFASANGAFKAMLESPDPLPGGQVLRFRVQMPDWPAHLHVAYLMTTGTAGNIVNAPTRHPAGASLALTDPKWVVGEPYGTELLLVVASERPLFGPQGRRRVVERLDQFAADLGTALSAAQDRGGRVAAQVVPVRTVMPR